MTRWYQMPPRYSSSKISLPYASPSPEVAITSPTAKITVEKLAQTAGVTPNHFLRLFHAAFDTTPIAYLNRLRLESASRALADTDMPVIDIALAVGYGDVSNFIRAFNKIYGMTPGRFRLRQKKDRRKPARLRLAETPDGAENHTGTPLPVAGKKPDA